MRVILTGFMILAMASAAQAVMTFKAVDAVITAGAIADDGTLAGATSWDVQVTSTYDLVGFAVTGFFFDGGGLYQHFAGNAQDLGPPPQWAINGMPAAEFDSYVQMPSTPLAIGLGLSNPPLDFADTVDDGPQTDFVMARITLLAPLATGTMYVQGIEADGIGLPISYEVELPEPATMSLLALGGLAVLRRRR